MVMFRIYGNTSQNNSNCIRYYSNIPVGQRHTVKTLESGALILEI